MRKGAICKGFEGSVPDRFYGNLLKIELEKQFLDHFREKKRDDDSVGTGNAHRK